jgi:hypothetical protein
MADTDFPFKRESVPLKLGNPERILFDRKAAPRRYGDPAGVITAVFQFFEALEDYRRSRLKSDISNYPAHN